MYKPVEKPGARILSALEEKGLKQIDLINMTGINKGALSSYISGRYEPKQDALYKMGRALDVSEMWLAGYDVPKERPAAQKENDALADIMQRARQDSEYRQLLIKAAQLNAEQIKVLQLMADQLAASISKE